MKRTGFLILMATLVASAAAIAQDTTIEKKFVTTTSVTTRRLTLDEAQALATAKAGENPMAKLAKLGAKVAEYKHKQAQADYFPKVGATFMNMHFNKFMGQQLALANRSFSVPLMNKDFTAFLTTVTQPLTPLLKVHEGVKIMRADEVVAKAKATAASQMVSANVEKTFYELIITQRQEVVTDAKISALEKQLQVASISAIPNVGIADKAAALLGATKASLDLKGKEIELTVTLNYMIGLPADTNLDLAMPAAAIAVDQQMTLSLATERAEVFNPAVIEAEQNVVKAKAAKKLSQLEYVPDVAVIGGYTYQNAVPLLPNDFSFVGVMATYNIYDFGKREHLVKERKTTLEMAEMALVLAKGAAAAQVKTSFYEVEKTRKLLEMTRRVITAQQMTRVSYDPNDPDQIVVKATFEVEVLQAELAYRKACANLQQLIGH